MGPQRVSKLAFVFLSLIMTIHSDTCDYLLGSHADSLEDVDDAQVDGRVKGCAR